MRYRSNLVVIYTIAFLLLLGILLPNLVFGQEGQPPYAPRRGKVWVWVSAHWEPARHWQPGAPMMPTEPPPVPPRVRKYWKWVPGSWALVSKPPMGPYEWSPAHWDPVEHQWVPGEWVGITVIPPERTWVPGGWDPVRRIWIAGHWEPVPAPTGPPVAPQFSAPPPGPPPGPPPPRPPRPGFHWEWDPIIKRWVQRPNP